MSRSNKRASKKKSCVEENAIVLKDGVREIVMQEVFRRKWPLLCFKSPHVPDEILVKEFYANAWRQDDPNPTFMSYSRGDYIKYDSHTINALLGGLDNFESKDEYTLMKDAPYPEAEIEKELLMDDCHWVRDAETGHALHIKYDQLKPVPQVWADIMLSNILPKSKCTELNKEHALLLYAICTGKSIDVGAVIAAEIHRMAQSTEGDLPYPVLITRLLESQRDDDEDEDPGPATIYPGVHNARSRGARRRN
ncbi:hypothetical protein RIF29_30832 [Crotalaria pallida]|uniref:Putative plant transposon protein domain-containing protein n=1 Tax=Crotalaria pallida TaxID=3830 RepID=A0AAN9EHC3_CROPI